MELPKAYDPKSHEDRIYSEWEKTGFFTPENLPGERTEAFTIALPPPNATGRLHLGHATMLAIEDLMIRFERMRGKKTLWVPGVDHAAIATQNVVEKALWKEEKKTRHDVGRVELLRRIELFVADAKKTIEGQMRKMGTSCDWSRERYTMDDGLSRAVRTIFVRMYDDGLIYRGNRIVNWCPRCQSTLSDDEVSYKEEKGKFYYFKYGPVIIGTARPETKFQDKTLVVHPDDERYRHLVGKTFAVPWIEDQPLTSNVIADPVVDQSFGTGAMTITPAHSFEDFDLAQRNNLPIVSIIDEQGNLTAAAGSFVGRNARKVRDEIVAVLQQKGLVERIDENYVHNLSVCYRCDSPIEPLPKLQWFVAVGKTPKSGGKSMKDRARDVVRDGSIRIVPDRFEKTYFHWMDNLRDWCISRQIWFGHQVPVWYKKDEVYVGVEAPTGDGWEQDPDTLDTWFSAGLWTFSTLGWPQDLTPALSSKERGTSDLATYHPTNVLETGYDILFFWVARMILMTTYALDTVPFKTVYLHGLVRDKQGRKMSKSLGNGIDPIEVIEKYGADALRLALIIGATPGNDVRLYDEKIAGFRNFVNKIWNVGRYVASKPDASSQTPAALTLADRWIAARFSAVVASVTKDLAEYQFSRAGETLRDFTWGDFADWYLEVKKIEGDDAGRARAMFVELLKLWHPFTPFVTEVLWKELGGKGMLMVAEWPKQHASQKDEVAEKGFSIFKDIVTTIRHVRSIYRVPTSARLPANVTSTSRLPHVTPLVISMCGLSSLTMVAPAGPAFSKNTVTFFAGGVSVALNLGETVDFGKERTRIVKDVEEKAAYVLRLDQKLSNEGFAQNAKEEVVAAERARLDVAREELERMRSLLK